MQIVFAEAFRHKTDLSFLHSRHSRLGKGLHPDKPLQGNHRFNGGAAPIAGADLMAQILDSAQVPALFQVLHNRLSGLVPIHAGVFRVVLGNFGVRRQADLHGQMATLAHLEVVGIVGRSDLHTSGSFIQLCVLVPHNRNPSAHQRQDAIFSDQMLVPPVLRVHRNGGIAQKRFGSCGGHLQIAASAHQRVADVPEMALLLLIVHFGVGNGGPAVGAPVDDALASVNQALFIKLYKDLFHRPGAALVHGEALSGPIAGGAHFLQLRHDPIAVFFLPVPCPLQKFLSAQVLLGQALFAHGLHDFGLGGNGSMVRSRQPERVIALHPFVTDENILQGIVQSVSHVQLSRNVGRRNHDGIGLCAFLGGLGRREISFFRPIGV